MSDNNQQSHAGYESMRDGNQESTGMGGGQGVHGSGVAGGHDGYTNTQSGTTGEKQDWLDKGIAAAGTKFGVNVSQKNADTAGDFINKEAKEYGGRNLPGVQ